MLLAKLPGHPRDKWVRCVVSIGRRQMVDFIEFVKDVTLLKNDPLSSKPAVDQYCERSLKGPQQNPSIRETS